MLAGSDFSGQLSTTFHSGVFMQGLIELAVSGGALQEQAGRASLTEATPHYTHTHTHTHTQLSTQIYPPMLGTHLNSKPCHHKPSRALSLRHLRALRAVSQHM